MDIFVSDTQKSNTCIECGNKKSREWNVAQGYGKQYQQRNKDVIKQNAKKWREQNPDKVREYNLTSYGRLISMLNQSRRRARQKGLEFSITRKDIVIPEYCPVLGIKLERIKGNGRTPNSLSIDRIDNNKGYTKENICIISWRANRLKNDATLSELKHIVKYIEEQLTLEPKYDS